MTPISETILEAQYHGPYVIKERKNDDNYIILSPDRRKATQPCHINVLKPYYERELTPQLRHVTAVIHRVDSSNESNNDVFSHKSDLSDTSTKLKELRRPQQSG